MVKNKKEKNIDLYSKEEKVANMLLELKENKKNYVKLIKTLKLLGNFNDKIEVFIYEIYSNDDYESIKLWCSDDDDDNIFIFFSKSTLKNELTKISKETNDGIFMYDTSLSKKIFCYHDGSTFIRGNYKLKSGKRIYWGCSNYRKNGNLKTTGCNTPIIYEEELVSVFKKILKSIYETKNDILEEIYEMILETNSKSETAKTQKKYQFSMQRLEKEKEELIGMRLRKEITIEEYNKYKEKLNNELDELKSDLEDLNKKDEQSKKTMNSFEEFKNKLIDIELNDENNILDTSSTLFSKIYVERIEEKKETKSKTIMLHIILNVHDYEKRSLLLKELPLLLMSNERFLSTIRNKLSSRSLI